MKSNKSRQRIASEAARLMYHMREPVFFRARMKAARRVLGNSPRQSELPTDREVGECIRALGELDEAAPATQKRSSPPAFSARQPDIRPDRFHLYQWLLLPLEKITGGAEQHPEGDLLYHSLQVFELAKNARPYDEEFLLAALLHDVGMAIDRREDAAAALDALGDSITPRTAWLIEHHAEAHAHLDKTLGARCRRRLAASEDYEELLLLAECDRAGRVQGAPVPDVSDALHYLRELAAECG
ncbi:MAG: phosphohydrolase [Patescibacteria group bacterium]|nr:phosphohydrolase [Patescibacteria group bacterium]